MVAEKIEACVRDYISILRMLEGFVRIKRNEWITQISGYEAWIGQVRADRMEDNSELLVASGG